MPAAVSIPTAYTCLLVALARLGVAEFASVLQVVSPSVWSLVPLLRELQQFSVVQRRLERQLVVFYRQQYQQQLQLEPELEWQRQPAEQQQQVQRFLGPLRSSIYHEMYF